MLPLGRHHNLRTILVLSSANSLPEVLNLLYIPVDDISRLEVNGGPAEIPKDPSRYHQLQLFTFSLLTITHNLLFEEVIASPVNTSHLQLF